MRFFGHLILHDNENLHDYSKVLSVRSYNEIDHSAMEYGPLNINWGVHEEVVVKIGFPLPFVGLYLSIEAKKSLK